MPDTKQNETAMRVIKKGNVKIQYISTNTMTSCINRRHSVAIKMVFSHRNTVCFVITIKPK